LVGNASNRSLNSVCSARALPTASPLKNCWLSAIILIIQILNLEARNGSLSAMAGLVCLCLKAAPGYINSRGFCSPLTFSNYCISFEHSFLHCHLLSLELSTSPAALAAIPSSTKTFPVYFLLAALLRTFFTLFLSKALDLELLTVPVSSPYPRHWLRSPPLQSTLKVYSLLIVIHIFSTSL
jgi:hypothetical protein